MNQSIVDRIRSEQKKARLLRGPGKFRAGVLTVLLAEVSIVGKNAQRETKDEEAVVVIAKFLKNLKETFKLYTGLILDNQERVDGEYEFDPDDIVNEDYEWDRIYSMLYEAEIYKEFLPVGMTQEEIQEEIRLVIRHYGAPKIGQVMGHFSKNFRGRYDGKALSETVKEML